MPDQDETDTDAAPTVEISDVASACRQSDERRRLGRALSLLDGVPIALKDNLACEGAPRRWSVAG